MTTTTPAPPTNQSATRSATEAAAQAPPSFPSPDTGSNPDRRPPRRRRRLLVALGAALLVLVVVVIAVAVAQSRSESGGTTEYVVPSRDSGSVPDGTSGGSVADPAAPSAAPTGAAADSATSRSTSVPAQRAVVSTGSVALSARDLDDVRRIVDGLLARYGGQIADEQTATDDRGRPTTSRLTLRVPADRFGAVMNALADTATLRSADRSSTDISTRVIDVQQQIKAQEAGLARLRTLMRQSSSLSSLLQVEQEVTRRQGELDSLKQQQAYLADQTSMSTITLSIDRATHHRPTPEQHQAGFLTGLERGWTAFVTVVRALGLALGATLPFLVLLLVLAVPGRWLWRRRHAAPVAG